MKAITTTVYQANDGSIWSTEAEGLTRETFLAEEAANTKFYAVCAYPDLTEGRGFTALVYLRVKSSISGYLLPAEMVADWCYRTYGRPIAFIQGVSPTLGWTIRGIDREDWLRAGQPDHYDRPYVSCGDTKHYAIQIALVMGPGTTGLTTEEISETI